MGLSAPHHLSNNALWYVDRLVLEFLFQAGARCDLRNQKQQTPLDVAKTDVLYSKLMFMLEIEETRWGTETAMALIPCDYGKSSIV